MEHIEEAGIHSGDSACALPPITLGRAGDRADPRARPRRSPAASASVGLLNVQYALAGDVLYVLEANPRASRTVPFVSKATAVPLAKAAARVDDGRDASRELRADGLLPAQRRRRDLPIGAPIAVKEAVLPFGRFHGVDTVLGPEMRSTGEVMGIDRRSARRSPSRRSRPTPPGLPTTRPAFVSVANRDKRSMIFPVKRLADLGFEILATAGTAEVLRRNGVTATVLRKTPRAGPTASRPPSTRSWPATST